MSVPTIMSTMLSLKSLYGSVDATTTAMLLLALLRRPVHLVLTLQRPLLERRSLLLLSLGELGHVLLAVVLWCTLLDGIDAVLVRIGRSCKARKSSTTTSAALVDDGD